VSVILIIVFCMIWPLGAALLALIPKGVGSVILMLATFIFIPAFFLGLAVAYSAVVVVVSLFYAPSITAVEGTDSFEVIYQEYRLLWGQPWRMLIYQILLFITKGICGSIYAIMSATGLAVIFIFPALIVHDKYAIVLSKALNWLGMSGGWIAGTINLGQPAQGGVLLGWIGAILVTITLMFVIGMIVSYVASIASAGSTMIYVILRKHHDDENLLEVDEEEEPIPGLMDVGTGEEAEEPVAEEEESSENKEE
jgi:hypothetical protein